MKTVDLKRSFKMNMRNPVLNISTFLAILASIILFAFTHSWSLFTALPVILVLGLRIVGMLEDIGEYICPFCDRVIQNSHIRNNCIWCNEVLPWGKSVS